MKYVYLALNWIFGVLFVLLGLIFLFESFYAAVCLFIISLLLLPPVRDAVYSKTNRGMPIKFRATSIFILLISFFIFFGISEQKKSDELEAQKAQEQAEQIAQARQEKIDYFQRNREDILSGIRSALSSKDYRSVIADSEAYLIVDDPELKQLYDQAKTALDEVRRAEQTSEILEKLKSIPASEYQENKDLYMQLVKLNPKNAAYKSKYEHYSEKIKEQAEKERQERQRLKEEQEKRIAKFGKKPIASGWDGSYLAVKQYLKRVANDPDSIEIDGCTKVYLVEEGWLVGCEYRGRNGFGGMVRQSNWFTIVHDRVIEMHAASAYSP